MFAVELGAAMLLQFELKDTIVRVLADAGEAKYDVNAKLPTAIEDFRKDQLIIDLLIGTHYDSDHLDGLVAIIKNQAITIREAWLPPIANDTEPHALEDIPSDENLLPLQLIGENNKQVLQSYLKSKADFCRRLAAAEMRGDEVRGIQRNRTQSETLVASDEPSGGSDGASYNVSSKAHFLAHIVDAERTIGVESKGHADEQIRLPWDVEEFIRLNGRNWLWYDVDIEQLSKSWLENRAVRATVEASTFAMLRRSTAKDAINAISLMTVVDALTKRNIKIRCATIPDGQPRRFHWSPIEKRFSPVQTSMVTGLDILLLGPSDGLVKKHWDRLPEGTYASLAMLYKLPIRQITPSNQLSYIMAFEFGDQRILVSGDAGCVDFKPSRKKQYHPNLIKALAPLHVLQVAHHAGHNAHFYRCLQESKYPAQQDISYLLLSHATKDKHRPSDVFSKFIESLSQNNSNFQLLFTSQPLEEKVRDVKPFIAGVVGPSGPKGDVRLVFDQATWILKKHAVKVP